MRRALLDYRAIDHAGREATLEGFAPSMTDHFRDREADPELSRLRRRVRSLVVHRPLAETIVTTFFVVGLVVVSLLALTAMGVTTAAVIAAVFTVAALVWDGRRGTQSQSGMVITAFLSAGRCPGCGYLLTRSPTGDLGMIQCPECAAMWRAEAVLEPIRPNPPLRKPSGWCARLVAELDDPMAERGRLVIDATGRALRMPDPALRRVCEPHLAVLGAERVAAVRREIRAAAVAVIPRRSVIYALLTAVFVVLAARRPSVPGEVVTPVMGAILGGAAIAAIAAWSLYGALAHGGFVKADRLVRIRVRHGVCPACMGVLNSASSTDGRVKCPTCGAEWPADGREGIEPAPSAA